jgi:hypothetical protein
VTRPAGLVSAASARRLADAGLVWRPANGDAFAIPGRDMDDDVFFLADMTVEVHRFATGEVIGFNGTVEWALDSIELTDTLWLPREDQLRAQLGGRFRGLRRAGDGYVVEVVLGGQDDDGAAPASERAGSYQASDAVEAYAIALLAVLLDQPVQAG